MNDERATILRVGTITGEGGKACLDGWEFDNHQNLSMVEVDEQGRRLVFGWPVEELRRIADGAQQGG